MPRDYDWDLESPIDDPHSVNRTLGPKYEDELRELYRVVQLPPKPDGSTDLVTRTEEIDEWEKTVELATYQFEVVPEVVESNPERAEMMFDTGELLVHNLLDEFDDEHAAYYHKFVSDRDTDSIEDLRDSYQEAYDILDSIDDDDNLAGGSLGHSKAGGELGGSISDTENLGGSIGDSDDNLGGSI
ncbi:hypothetical protein [Haloarcula argentinensis]|uniref:Uncharacterized protein n=1 Tax=Haloarcula argentinensis TaxID=43776 RepID=A0A847U4M6_HALAR|nr:hypothetical protein [Haloarcula argentinensis]NLV13242.1 hypothetical protein [Haloarcula argentinensis]